MLLTAFVLGNSWSWRDGWWVDGGWWCMVLAQKMPVPCRHFTSVHGKGQFTIGGSAPWYSKGFLGQPWRACVQDFFSSRRMQAQTAMSSANMSWTAGHVEFVWIFWINYVCTRNMEGSSWSSHWQVQIYVTPSQVNHLLERDTANIATSMGEGAPGLWKTGQHLVNQLNQLEKSGSWAAETLIHFAGLVVIAEAEAAVVSPGVVRAVAAAAAAEAAEAACGAAAANENEKLQLVFNFVKPWTFHCSTPSIKACFDLFIATPELCMWTGLAIQCWFAMPFNLSVKIAWQCPKDESLHACNANLEGFQPTMDISSWRWGQLNASAKVFGEVFALQMLAGQTVNSANRCKQHKQQNNVNFCFRFVPRI